MEKNNQCKAFLGVFLVLAILLVVQINVVSAIELNPFATKKIVDDTKTMDLNDFMLKEISDYPVIKLSKTFLWFETDRIAEYKIIENECGFTSCRMRIKARTYSDEILFDDKMKYLDLINGGETLLNTQYYIRGEDESYSVDVEDYKKTCITQDYCTYDVIGTHKEDRTRETWTPYNQEIVKSGEHEIELRGTIKVGQSIDVIPYAQNKEFSEWAVWTSGLNDSLITYIGFDGGVGTNAYNSYNSGSYDATLDDANQWNETNYKLGNSSISMETATTRTGQITDALTLTDTQSFSMNMWIYRNANGANQGLVAHAGSGFSLTYEADDKLTLNERGSAWYRVAANTSNQVWEMISLTWNSTDMAVYRNGVYAPSIDTTYSAITLDTENLLLGEFDTYDNPLVGEMDELSIWNRTLSSTEISDLWNGGEGLPFEGSTGLSATLSSPPDNFATTSLTLDLSCNFTSSGSVNISNVTIRVFDSSTNLDYTNTNLTPAGATQSFNKTWTTSTLTDDSYNWSCSTFGDDSSTSLTGNRTFTIDSTAPSTNLTSPSGAINYHKIGNNLSMNWTVSDTNIDSCWFAYNNTNTTVTCTANNYSFTPVSGKQNLTFYANDTSNNAESNFTSWTYLLLFTNETYVASTTDGSSTTFTSNFTTNGTRIETIYLNYNNTRSIATLSSTGDNYYATISQLAPGVEIVTNISFFWNVTMEGSASYSTDENNQTVSSIGINNTCGAGTNVIYNMTIADEITQAVIDGSALNGSIKVDFNLYTSDRGTSIDHYYAEKTNTNNMAICIDSNLSNDESYSMDLQIQYDATNYSAEFYNIERAILSNSTLNTNITLYDLDDDNAQIFQLNVRDKSYVGVSGALVRVERKYIENGTFYVAEIPLTDTSGIASASLQVDSVIYNFYIYQGGSLISSFTNVLATCQNPTLRECSIDFNSYLDGLNIPDYATADNFNFTLDYNKTSRVITSQFVIPNGTPSLVKLEVIREDTLGTAVCSDTLTSSAGTLTCEIPSQFGNATIVARLYKSSVVLGSGTFKIDQSPSDIFGVILVFLSVLVMMTLIGVGVSDNPVVTGVFLFVGLILIFSMNLVQNTGFYGATASILFFAIAMVIVIIKAARRN